MAGGITQHYAHVVSTAARSTLKRYFEINLAASWSGQAASLPGAGDFFLGVTDAIPATETTAPPGKVWCPVHGAVVGGLAGLPTLTNPISSIVGVALDFVALKMWFSFGGVWVGDPVAGTGESTTLAAATPYYAYAACGGNRLNNTPTTFPNITMDVILRTRNAQFTYAKPTGYVSFATP